LIHRVVQQFAKLLPHPGNFRFRLSGDVTVEEAMTPGRIERRRILQSGLAGIAAVGPLPIVAIGARRAMADTVPETAIYVSNAGSRDISVLAMNRNTGELTLIEKKEVPGSD
jgi:hypothetical protein